MKTTDFLPLYKNLWKCTVTIQIDEILSAFGFQTLKNFPNTSYFLPTFFVFVRRRRKKALAELLDLIITKKLQKVPTQQRYLETEIYWRRRRIVRNFYLVTAKYQFDFESSMMEMLWMICLSFFSSFEAIKFHSLKMPGFTASTGTPSQHCHWHCMTGSQLILFCWLACS